MWTDEQCAKVSAIPKSFLHVTDKYDLAEDLADQEEVRTHKPIDIVWFDGLYYVIDGVD